MMPTTSGRETRRRLPLYVAAAAFASFWPSLWNGFVWDDKSAVVDNYAFRGLGLRNLRWMFTTFHLGHYEPLTWMSLAVDYLLHGTAPWGYHATNSLLHAANAALFYLVARRLLDAAFTEEFPGRSEALSRGAAFASLAFAVHPLRVESVAWVTERRDVLSGFFFLATLLFYLKDAELSDRPRQRRWLWASVACYLLSLLSKATGATLPLVLVILDAYPLRRSDAADPKVWLRKTPYLALAAAAAVIAPLAQSRAGAMEPLATYGPGPRLAQAVFGAGFYLWKTLIPLRLLPFYRFPDAFNPLVNRSILWSLLATGGISAAVLAARRRWPAGAALWAYYLVVLAPVLGIFQSGPQFAADRYTYLACLGWALLGGAGVARLRATRPDAGPLATAPWIYLLVLSGLTWRQTDVWRDSTSLWAYDAAADPGASLAHNNLCAALRDERRLDAAEAECREALRLRPGYPNARDNLAGILAAREDWSGAIAGYRAALETDAGDPSIHVGLARALAKAGSLAEAISEYEAAARLKPDDPTIQDGLGSALKDAGRLDEATGAYEKALSLDPKDAQAHNGLGAVHYQRNRLGDAVREYEAALALGPDDPQLHSNLGAALDEEGKSQEALRQYEEALRLKPNYAVAYNNMGIVLFKLGRFDEAMGDFQRALDLEPAYADARANLEHAAELRRRAAGMK